MNPKKPSEIAIETAKELGIDQKIVDAVLSFHWKTVRKMIVSLEHVSIQVTNFGTFKVRSNQLAKRLGEYEKMLEARDKLTFKNAKRHADLKAKVLKLRELSDKLAKEKENKKLFKARRDEKQFNKDLERKG